MGNLIGLGDGIVSVFVLVVVRIPASRMFYVLMTLGDFVGLVWF